jgi:predicted AlkP superfamily pyrophosphatase or phosphodiesterase
MEIITLLRTCLVASATLLLISCVTPSKPSTPVTPVTSRAPPKLLVLVVVDGLPQRQINAYRDQLAPDGFARFLDRGTWFANANYAHAFTVTAAGHAVMLTGAYPDLTGIIGNEWRNPETGVPVYNTQDLSATYIGHKTNAFDGTSPKNLRVQTVGDMLRAASPVSKVIAISGKDRGAILPAGKSGTAYMYMAESGGFASTTHYMAQHPSWVTAYNAAKPADRYFKTEWKALLPEAAYARSLPDSQPWFGPAGGKLPMMMGVAADDMPGPMFYNAVMRSPFGDALTLGFARAAIAGEQLGQRGVPDILSVSLSSHDYINHAFSAESRLSHDHLLQLDRQLERFFADLDKTIGQGNYAVVLTADHGFMPAPEVLAAQGLPSGRLNASQLLGRLNAGLEKRFGLPESGKWAMGFSGSSLLLDKKQMAEAKLDPMLVAQEAQSLLLAEPAMAAAYTRAELLADSSPSAPLFNAMRKAWHPDVSGDVQYALKPNWMFASTSSVATHGSPYAYDTQVPLLVYAPGWYKPGSVETPVDMASMAPTLARLLGVARPPAAAAAVLPLQAP